MVQQEGLDLAYGHASGVHGDDLVVEACEASLVFGNQQRLKAAVSVTRHFDTNRAVLSQHRLGAFAIALVGGAGRLGRTDR